MPLRENIDCIAPDWPVPDGVCAISTTRSGGVSLSPWGSLNLGDHVADTAAAVTENRRLLVHTTALPRQPNWLQQVHGCDIADSAAIRVGDGRYSRLPGEVCAVLTADCLPVLLCNTAGNAVAAVHAGWRGLAAGVLETAVQRFAEPAEQLLAWMGPAIGPHKFEVGANVRQVFIACDANAGVAFRQTDSEHWLADIYQLASQRLQAAGVRSIYGGGYCTVSDQQRFFSYRRDGVTGRMASLIWIEEA